MGSANRTMDWYLGTMGFGYQDWQPVFYPAGLPSRNFLRHYGSTFNAVELDTTFYGTPSRDQVLRWAHATPEGFKFCAKVPRAITHEARLVRATVQMNEFVGAMQHLAGKLGVILIQLPPDFTFAEAENLSLFLLDLPKSVDYAVEFRHASWVNPQTAALLRERGVCWAVTEYLDLPIHIEPTCDFLYIRWIGEHGRFERKDHERVDLSERLHWWYEQLEPHFPGVARIYGFFNNDYAGHSPATCNRFKRIVGLPVVTLQPPQQQRLF